MGVAAPVAKSQDDIEREETRRKIVSHAAHELLNKLLAEAGLPGDVKKVIGRTCSFWCSSQVHDDPYTASIIGVSRVLGGGVKLRLSFGPNGSAGSISYSGGQWVWWPDQSLRFDSSRIQKFELL